MKINRRRWQLLLLSVMVAGVLSVSARLLLKQRPVTTGNSREIADQVRYAEAALRAGRAVAAETRLQQVLQQDPANTRAALLMILILQDRGDLQQAWLLAERLRDISDDDLAEARFAQGALAVQMGDAVVAESRFRESHAADPDYLPPLRELISLYALQMRRSDLLEALDEVAAHRQFTVAELAMRILAGRPIQESAAAIDNLRRFVAANPADAVSRTALVRYLLQGENPTDALEIIAGTEAATSDHGLTVLLRAAATIPPERLTTDFMPQPDDPVEVWQLAAQSLAASGRWEELLELAEYGVARDPWSPQMTHLLARALDRMGRPEEASEYHGLTGDLDQLELLAYRMLRPQAEILELGQPVMREIAARLKNIQRGDEARLWEQALGIHPQTESEPSQSPEAPPAPQIRIPVAELVSDLTETEPAAAAVGISFQDVADQFQLDFSYHNGSSEQKLITETVGGGAAVIDLDGDTWPDIYLPQGQLTRGKEMPPTEQLLNDGLFRNLRGQHFDSCVVEAGIRELSHGMAATVEDFDNDGFADLLVANVGSCRLYQNLGDGTFGDVGVQALETASACSSGACFADLNGDGNPELFVINYVEEWMRVCINASGQPATCDPRELQPAVNQLLLNNGDGTFSDISRQVGLEQLPGRALGVVATDLNCDGRMELFVANDGMPNQLLTFPVDDPDGRILQAVDVASLSGVAVPQNGRTHAGMGVAVADFDWNGFPDLFVTNFYRESNSLYSGQACGLFLDVTQQHGAPTSGFELLGFGAQAADFDADGWTDVVIANGDIDDYSASGRPWQMPMLMLRNDGTGSLIDVSGLSGPALQSPQIGRGLAVLDFDGDGGTDVVNIRHDGPVRLLRNSSRQQSPICLLRMIDTIGVRSGTGSGLHTLSSDGISRHYRLISGGGFAAANEQILRVPVRVMANAKLGVQWGAQNVSAVMSPVDLIGQPALWAVVREAASGSARQYELPR